MSFLHTVRKTNAKWRRHDASFGSVLMVHSSGAITYS